MTRQNNSFDWTLLDLFAPYENLKIKGAARHGSCCGVTLTIAISILVLAYALNEWVAVARDSRIHAYSFSTIDFLAGDEEVSLADEGT